VSAPAPRNRLGGFSLIECVVALILVGALLALLGPLLLFSASERATAEGAMVRDALLRGEASRLASLPFAQLDAEVGCQTRATPVRLPHTKCVAVAAISSFERRVVVRLTPTAGLVRADSVSFSRAIVTRNPFDTVTGP
jgi:prepilin-type N-terminal cleavage/methylation domain-containing protein